MMDDADWTPMIGWRKAAWMIPARTAIAMGVAWGAFWVLWVFMQFLSSETGGPIVRIGWGITLALGVGVGVVAGTVISRGLMESTGLLGSYLIAPALGFFIGGLLAIQWLTGQIVPNWTQISLWILMTGGIVGTGLALRQFIMDA